MKRILVLIKGLGRGGAEQLLVSAAPYLDRDRFDYDVAYLLPHKDALVKELEDHGISATCLRGTRGVSWVERLRRFVRERQIDLVHAHSPYAAVGARLGLVGSARARLVYTEHGVWEYYRPVTRWLNLLTYPRNDHVFAVSRFVESRIRLPWALRLLPMPPVQTLYHGLDPTLLSDPPAPNGIREELGIDDGPLVVHVANFRPQKNHDLVLRAASLLRTRVPGARFLLVGDGPELASVRERAASAGLADTVIFTGRRTDAVSIMAAADAFILPSHYEGLPIALLEAMALGRPIVVTDVGGTRELVSEGDAGLVVPPDDEHALAAALDSILTGSVDGVALGERARRRAADFDIRAAVRKQERVYEELLR